MSTHDRKYPCLPLCAWALVTGNILVYRCVQSHSFCWVSMERIRSVSVNATHWLFDENINFAPTPGFLLTHLFIFYKRPQRKEDLAKYCRTMMFPQLDSFFSSEPRRSWTSSDLSSTASIPPSNSPPSLHHSYSRLFALSVRFCQQAVSTVP